MNNEKMKREKNEDNNDINDEMEKKFNEILNE